MDRSSINARLAELRGKIAKLPAQPFNENGFYGRQAVTDSEWKVKERQALEAEARELERTLASLDDAA